MGCQAASAGLCLGMDGARQAAPPTYTPFPKQDYELGSNEKLIRQLC